MSAAVLAGPTNGLTDVPGLRVGHVQLRGEGALTGVTVVLAPPAGAVGGVDVRGAAPGTRETDLLDPRNTVERVHAVVLTGGSAYGLAAADGVVERLAAAGVGFPVAPSQGEVVPIVPAAVIFDLGRGGLFTARPSAEHGAAAYDAASGGPVPQGCVGAGTGAVAGGLKGGVGTASVLLAAGGGVVAALVVVNAAGSTVDPRTGELYGARFGVAGEFDSLRPPVSALPAPSVPPTTGRATTLAVLATDVTLTKAQCACLAGAGHDGMARAIRPLHTPFDGDTVFALSTTRLPAPDVAGLHEILSAGADCITRAVVHAMLAATSVTTPANTWLCYLDSTPAQS
jgi:L-aminopeptidase/D-esterase-like protein